MPGRRRATAGLAAVLVLAAAGCSGGIGGPGASGSPTPSGTVSGSALPSASANANPLAAKLVRTTSETVGYSVVVPTGLPWDCRQQNSNTTQVLCAAGDLSDVSGYLVRVQTWCLASGDVRWTEATTRTAGKYASRTASEFSWAGSNDLDGQERERGLTDGTRAVTVMVTFPSVTKTSNAWANRVIDSLTLSATGQCVSG